VILVKCLSCPNQNEVLTEVLNGRFFSVRLRSRLLRLHSTRAQDHQHHHHHHHSARAQVPRSNFGGPHASQCCASAGNPSPLGFQKPHPSSVSRPRRPVAKQQNCDVLLESAGLSLSGLAALLLLLALCVESTRIPLRPEYLLQSEILRLHFVNSVVFY